MFETGLREMIVGKGVAQNFVGAKVGGSVRMRGSDWAVVGVFDSGDAHNSELIADAETAQSAFGRRGYTSLIAQLDGADGLTKLKDAVSADPRLNADIQLEQEYYTSQTRQFRQTIGFIGFIVTFIMGMGAIFAALNTMYAAVATRSREIATLRALGFRGLPVVASVMIESLVLALIGGALGAGIAYVLFNNSTVSTLGQNFTQVVFTFQVTPALVIRGLVISVLIGMVGGLLPAIRAARLPVTTALRQA